MFTKAKNNNFKNNSFTINNNTTNFNSSTGPALDILYSSVAPNAILNAGGRADEVRCHPGTRTEIIGLINKWRLDIQHNVKPNQMFWLSGPAGAGKTAIVQTIAEDWKSLGINTANFFFFRNDPSRSDARPFMSTLLYQIFDFFPAAREAVERVLRMRPRILEAGLDEQVEKLICDTFRSIKPPFPHPIILLIDGLDECDSETKASQKQIMQVLDKLVRQEGLPFLVLVASRAEMHILAAFTRLSSQAQSIFLNDQYSPEADIRLFVTAEFQKIKVSHPHAALLERTWPSTAQVDAIVRKSSGHFIYAATVMRFLAQSSAVPSFNLEKVQGIVPCTPNSPFVYLDAIYIYILQHAEDAQAIRDILSSVLLYKEISSHRFVGRGIRGFLPPIQQFLELYNARYTKLLFVSCISGISSIVQLNDNRPEFYHASLSDFLLDQSRSSSFYVDISKFAANVLPCVWSYHHPSFNVNGCSLTLGATLFQYVQRPTPAITNALLTEHPSHLDSFFLYFRHVDILEFIYRLYYPHERENYKRILKRWVIWAVLVCPQEETGNLYNYCGPENWSNSFQREAMPLLKGYILIAKIRKVVNKFNLQ